MTCCIHVNDLGTVFILQVLDQDGVAVDISSATDLTLYITQPTGDLLTRNCVFNTDGVDGKLKYVIASGDLSKQGIYQMQARVTMPAGLWHSSIVKFEVSRNIGT